LAGTGKSSSAGKAGLENSNAEMNSKTNVAGFLMRSVNLLMNLMQVDMGAFIVVIDAISCMTTPLKVTL
jgi:hypothetical protein